MDLPVVQPWLYGYDAYEEVEGAISSNQLSSEKEVNLETWNCIG